MSYGAIHVGSIHIGYDLADDGEPITTVTTDGDMPLVTQLGLLRLAEDTLMNGALDDEEDGDD